MILFLALRNFVRLRKRYFLVGLAVLVGFALVFVVSGTALGALEAMRAKAARYFAGDVSVQGFPDGDRAHQRIRDAETMCRELRGAGLGIRSATPRNIYYGDDATLIFGGEVVRQRRLVGVNFDQEAAAFAGLACIEGSISRMTGEGGRDGILISEAAAKILGAHLGDDVTITLTTDKGQYNSGTLVVRGIFRETSLFGYLAYMQLDALNELTRRPKGSATDIAIYGRAGEDSTALAERIRQFLAKSHTVLPRMAVKADIDAALPGIKRQSYAVLPLEGNLTQMRDIVQAFLAITWVAVGIFIAIVMVGILNTFRVIAYERTREIGTMRAIGMQRGTVLGLFVAEAFFMAMVACMGGLLAGYAGFGLLGLIDLGRIPVTGLFTERGRLGFSVDPASVFLDFSIMLCATIAAAFGPARRAAMADPAEALRTEG